MSDLSDDYALLIAAVRDAGTLAMRYFGASPIAWEKQGGTLVSNADLAVDAFLRGRLTNARPEYGWLSEETEDDHARLTRCRVWVVDPIDGTRAFLEGLPHFCHSVALVEDGWPIMGALYNPATDEFYEALAGRGAKLNGRPINVSARSEIAGCRMAAFAPMFRHPAWREPWPEMQIIQRDSVAYRIALVASSNADAAFGLNPKNDWDLAAAHIVVVEAGGVMTSHDGQKMHYNRETPIQKSFLAAGHPLHAEISARVGHIRLPPRRNLP
ncbi:3'(2'),5'-bisphosphate nucleotidase CysQ [Bradyrhizobium sp. USDA 4486]